MSYQHTQYSPATLRIAVLVLLAVVGTTVAVGGSPAGLAVILLTALIVGAALAVFSRLTIEMTDAEVRAVFGWGWPRRVVSLSDIVSVTRVRNSWWYGFGIRWFPGGTLWNVWGLDGVEFDLGDARKVRFGTDEPEALMAALSGRVQAF